MHLTIKAEKMGIDGEGTTPQIQMMSALAQPTRLHVFKILARHRPGGMSVQELADAAGTPHNNMSVHLSVLARAGLVTSNKVGRVNTYVASASAVRDLALFLVTECCGGCPQASEALIHELDCCCGDAVRAEIGDAPI